MAKNRIPPPVTFETVDDLVNYQGILPSTLAENQDLYSTERNLPFKKLGKYDTGLTRLSGNQEHYRAENQRGWGLLPTAAGRLIASTITKTLEGVAAMGTGFTENALSKEIADAEKHILNEWFPVYKSQGMESDSLMERLKEPGWWASTATDGAAFMLSAILGSKGISALSKLGLAGKLAKGIGASDDILMQMDKLSRSTVGKVLGLEKNGVGAATAYGAFNEAFFESKGVIDQVKNQISKEKYGGDFEYLSPEQQADVMQAAGKAGQETFWANLPVLLLTERIFNETILGSFFGLPEASAFSRIIKEGDQFKLNALSKGQRAALYGLPFAANIPTEMFQENYQLAVENYFTKKATGKSTAGLLEGILGEMGNNFTSIEGKESMFLGGLLGGLGAGASLGNIGKQEKYANQYLDILNGHYGTLNKAASTYFEKDNAGNIVFENGLPKVKSQEAFKQEFDAITNNFEKYQIMSELRTASEMGDTSAKELYDIAVNDRFSETMFQLFQNPESTNLVNTLIDSYAEKYAQEYEEITGEKADKAAKVKELKTKAERMQSLYNLAETYYQVDGQPASLAMQYHSLFKQDYFKQKAKEFRSKADEVLSQLPIEDKLKIEDAINKPNKNSNNIIDAVLDNADFSKIDGVHDKVDAKANVAKALSFQSLYDLERQRFDKEFTKEEFYKKANEKIEEEAKEESEKAKKQAVVDEARRKRAEEIAKRAAKAQPVTPVKPVTQPVAPPAPAATKSFDIKYLTASDIYQNHSFDIRNQTNIKSTKEFELAVVDEVEKTDVGTVDVNTHRNFEALMNKYNTGGGVRASVIEAIREGIEKEYSAPEIPGINRETIEDYFKNNDGKAATTIAREIDTPIENVKFWLDKLVEEGKLVKKGNNRYYKVKNVSSEESQVEPDTTDTEAKKSRRQEELDKETPVKNENIIVNDGTDNLTFKVITFKDGSTLVRHIKTNETTADNKSKKLTAYPTLEDFQNLLKYDFDENAKIIKTELVKDDYTDKQSQEIKAAKEKTINAKYDAELKADLAQGKVGNTHYEVKADGVYFEGKKLDNPDNKTHKQLIEADIERRRQEDLDRPYNKKKQELSDITEIASYGETYGDALNNLIKKQEELNNALNKRQKEDTKDREVKQYTKEELEAQPEWKEIKRLDRLIINEINDVYGSAYGFDAKTSDGVKEVEQELKELPNKRKTADSKINAKYDAERAALENQPTSTTQSEIEAKKADIKKDRYYNSPANRMVRVQKESQNTDVTQEEIDEIETIIEKAKELGWDKNRLFRQLTSMGYSYALGVNPEAFKNYLEDRLSGKTNIKVTNEYNFFKQLDAELKALDIAQPVDVDVLEEEVIEVAPINVPTDKQIREQNEHVITNEALSEGHNVLGNRVVQMEKTIEGGIVHRANKDGFLLDKDANTAAMHSNVKVGDKIQMSIPVDFMETPMYIDNKNNETVTFRKHMAKVAPENYRQELIDNLPITISHNGVDLGYVHRVSWINDTNLIEKEFVSFEEQKAQLRAFREQFVDSSNNVLTEATVETEIDFKGPGKLARDTSYKPLSEAVPSFPIAVVTANRTVKTMDGKVITLSHEAIPGQAGFLHGNKFFVAKRKPLNEEDKNTLKDLLLEPVKSVNKIASMVYVSTIADVKKIEASLRNQKTPNNLRLAVNKNSFYIYEKSTGTLYANPIKNGKLDEYLAQELVANIIPSKENQEWASNNLLTNIREIEANYDGNVEPTIFVHNVVRFQLPKKTLSERVVPEVTTEVNEPQDDEYILRKKFGIELFPNVRQEAEDLIKKCKR